MAKIISFKSQKDNTQDFLDEIKEEVEKNNIENIMFAAKLKDGTVMTGYTSNFDWGTKQELLGHIQVDIINQMIKENYVTPD